MAQFQFNIPSFDGPEKLEINSGQSVVFLGANGAGKTRLGVHIDKSATGGSTHRIGAHRALNLNTKVQTKNLESALNEFLYGIEDPKRANQKEAHRWSQKPYTVLLNDYDKLLAALFADDAEISTRFSRVLK